MLAISPVAVISDPLNQEPEPVLILEPRPASNDLPPLELTPEQAMKVGRQVWLNETGGNRDMITAWNATEDFASMGIGHFIWFSEGLDTRFKESFPTMMAYLRSRGAKLPGWLDKPTIPPSPWSTREQFLRDFNKPKMTELRAFLHDNVGLQAEYLAIRMQAALPKILDALETPAEREHVRAQFIRVATASPDLYPLIDYINFKGEGIAPSETFPNRDTGVPEGWGLKDVLLAMKGTSTDRDAVLGEFSDAAAFALNRRIRNNPPNKRWQRGWLKRTDTYARPLR